jgi:hypothetical protein
MRRGGWLVVCAPAVCACGQSSSPDTDGDAASNDAACDPAPNPPAPDAITYACDAEPSGGSGCVGDPCGDNLGTCSDASYVHAVGCKAFLPRVSGCQVNQPLQCCSAVTCYCGATSGGAIATDGAPEWSCAL